ncbi:ParA family protein [Stenotrophomonas bentonitica]|uniref:ParA family protein n=1 Tax=Stenotrophomonas bentonitica TaxID=1450134 RepID=UPI00345F0324
MKVISFVNMKGGVGKTTLALNVAHCLSATHGKRVAVIDIDPQFNLTQCMFSGEEYVGLLKSGVDTVVNLFDDEPKPIASSVAGASVKSPKTMSDIGMQKKKGLNLLPGNIDLYRIEMSPGEGREFALKRFVDERLEGNFDYVIIDTPPTPSIWMSSALIASQYYLIPVKPDPLSLIGIDLLKSIIDRKKKNFGLNIACAGVVFTLVERPDSIPYYQGRENLLKSDFWKSYLYDNYLPKRTGFARTQIEQPFILHYDDFDLRESLKGVVNELLEELGDD